MTEYPTENQIIELNKDVLKRIKVKKADAHKVLSHGKLARAIEESKADTGDVYGKASTLLMSLTRGHAFESANRRTAIAVTEIFLRANGEIPKLKHDERVLIGIREGFYTKLEIKNWLKGDAIRPFNR
ncbi:MAG: Fic family protein [Nitrososphaerales archaeon]